MSEQTFIIAGVSTYEGQKTFRFANGEPNLRANMLRHCGHENIDLHKLPRAMTKVQAMAWVMENVRGAKNAVLRTRANDKTVKNELVLAAEALVASRAKARATREARKNQPVAA